MGKKLIFSSIFTGLVGIGTASVLFYAHWWKQKELVVSWIFEFAILISKKQDLIVKQRMHEGVIKDQERLKYKLEQRRIQEEAEKQRSK
jgi:hypothetical protein